MEEVSAMVPGAEQGSALSEQGSALSEQGSASSEQAPSEQTLSEQALSEHISDAKSLLARAMAMHAWAGVRQVEGRTPQKLKRRAKEKNRRATVAAQRRKNKK